MSCPEFVFSQQGRKGVGVVQPQSGLDYPFVAPSPDVRYLITDFHLSFDDPGEYGTVAKIVPPLRIKYLYNIGCEENTQPTDFPAPRDLQKADIRIVDANNQTVLDTFTGDVEYSTQAWGNDYRIYNWRKKNQVCSLLAYTTWSPDNDAANDSEPPKKHYPKYLAPVNAQLDARATYKMPKRLRSISVKSGPNCATICGPFAGPIVFKNGRNTTIAAADTTVNNFRVNTALTFSAVAGSGAGKYSSCPDTSIVTQPIKTINGIKADNGSFVIAATDCLWAKKPTTKPAGAAYVIPKPGEQQQIGGNCGPCCECEDYAAAADYLNNVQSFYTEIGRRAENVKLRHEENVSDWIDQQTCSINPLKLLLVPQRCPYLDVLAMICNPCQECIPSSVVRVELQPSIAAQAELVIGKTAMYGVGEDGRGINGRPWPITRNVLSNNKTAFSITFPRIKGGANTYIQFRVKFSVKTQYIVSGTMTATELVSGDRVQTGCANSPTTVTRVNAVATKSEALYCTIDGKTEFPG